MKSYKAHLQGIKSFGETVDEKAKPIFRSSAVFPVFDNENLKTRILYMGYWLLKRNIAEIGLLVTLRGHDGNILKRDSITIDSSHAREVRVDELLKEIQHNGKEFLGSVELEIFSTQDLVFPYPAFVVNYYNDWGSSVVHTTGRIYNDFEDLQSNEAMIVKECGFDIFPGEKYDPFFTFINGHIEMESNVIEFEIVGENGNRHTEKINFGKLGALETSVLRLKEFLPVDEVLDGSVGTVKIKHNFRGFFPRFVAGNFCTETKAVSITHSFYDNSQIKDESAYWTNDHDTMLFDSVLFVPLFVEGDWYTELKLYPIYSPSTHTINLVFHDEHGNEIGRIDNYMVVSEDQSKYFSIDFKEIIDKLNLDRSRVKGVYLVKNWESKSGIPTRLKYGLNIGCRNLKYDLPTNICFNSQVSNVKTLDKKGTFKWLPIVNHAESIAIIENTSYIKKYDRVANIKVSFYKTDSDETIEKDYSLPANSQIRIHMDDEFTNFLEGNSGWITIKSDNPFVKAWYFDFNESGIMGGDHSF